MKREHYFYRFWVSAKTYTCIRKFVEGLRARIGPTKTSPEWGNEGSTRLSRSPTDRLSVFVRSPPFLQRPFWERRKKERMAGCWLPGLVSGTTTLLRSHSLSLFRSLALCVQSCVPIPPLLFFSFIPTLALAACNSPQGGGGSSQRLWVEKVRPSVRSLARWLVAWKAFVDGSLEKQRGDRVVDIPFSGFFMEIQPCQR